VKNAGSESGTNYRSHKEGTALVSQMIFTLATLRLAWLFNAMSCLCVQFLDTAVTRQRCALQTSTKCNLPLRNSEVLKRLESSETAYGLE